MIILGVLSLVRFYFETNKQVIPLEKGKIKTFPKKLCYFQRGKLVFY
jgi:hypothetical protein